MTKRKGYLLAAVGVGAVILAILLVVFARAGAIFAPVSDGVVVQSAKEKASGSAAVAETEYNAISKLSIGMTEDVFKRLRPNAKPLVDIDKGRSGERTPAKGEETYLEGSGEDSLRPRMGSMYLFKEGKLSLFTISWRLSGKDAISTASLVVRQTRERYGRENERIMRDLRQPRPESQPGLCPELIWHRGAETIVVDITGTPGGDLEIGFFVRGAVHGQIPSDPLHSAVPVSKEEEQQVLKQFGIPPL